jgi:hypothetical protein
VRGLSGDLAAFGQVFLLGLERDIRARSGTRTSIALEIATREKKTTSKRASIAELTRR